MSTSNDDHLDYDQLARRLLRDHPELDVQHLCYALEAGLQGAFLTKPRPTTFELNPRPEPIWTRNPAPGLTIELFEEPRRDDLVWHAFHIQLPNGRRQLKGFATNPVHIEPLEDAEGRYHQLLKELQHQGVIDTCG